MEEDTRMSIEENKALVRRFVEELWNARNLDVANEIIHPEKVPGNYTAGAKDHGPKVKGPEVTKRNIERHSKGASDLRRTIIDMVAEGDKVVLYSKFTGTHTEENTAGYAPTGEVVETTGVATLRIKDGKLIDEPWACWNHSADFQQLTRAVVRLYVEKVWNDGDLESADLYIATDYVRHDSAAPGKIRGIESLRKTVALFRAAFPDIQYRVEDVIADGNNKGVKAAMRWSATGTHCGELMGVEPTGKAAQMSGYSFLRLEDGKIAEEWVQWDNSGLLQQAGAMLAKE